MKFKLVVTILVLSLIAWAQENPSGSTPNASPAPAKSCCHHAANASEAAGCCHHASADTKDTAECCAKGKCEMKNAKCCSGKAMKKCMKECKKNGTCTDGKCCGIAGEKSAKNCCGTQCERHKLAS
jgi:hypothetical protein